MGSNIEENTHRNQETSPPDEWDGFGLSIFNKNKNTVKMVSGIYDLYYKMDHRRRGYAVIFNHEKFVIPKLKNRDGTNEDCNNLKTTLKQLGFDVTVFNDLTTSEIMEEVDKISSKDHSDCDCFVMCILTHGDKGILYSKNTAYEHDNIFCRFTANHCKSLAGKPKLFFVQACQGDSLDGGVTVTQVDSGSSYRIPVFADFLVAYSTIPGFYSWRNTTKGSWFVQSLCAVLKDYAYTYDLLTILTLVNQKVAIEFESNVPGNKSMHAQKQIPYITFMLMRIVKFSQKEGDNSNFK